MTSMDPVLALRRRITIREFLCSGPSHHHVKFAVRHTSPIAQDADSSKVSGAEFQPIGSPTWSRIATCPECSSLAFELKFYDPNMAQVPESERSVFWLSADGQRLAVPGKQDAAMPERYVSSGYKKVEAYSMRDLEKFAEIRAAQTGNDVYSEMVYSEADRAWRQEAELDTDTDAALTRDI